VRTAAAAAAEIVELRRMAKPKQHAPAPLRAVE